MDPNTTEIYVIMTQGHAKVAHTTEAGAKEDLTARAGAMVNAAKDGIIVPVKLIDDTVSV